MHALDTRNGRQVLGCNGELLTDARVNANCTWLSVVSCLCTWLCETGTLMWCNCYQRSLE